MTRQRVEVSAYQLYIEAEKRELFRYEDSSERFYPFRYDHHKTALGQLPDLTLVLWEDIPEPSCDGKIVEIDGKKYTLKEV